MDHLGILEDRLAAVERLYADAAGVFAERMRKINAGEEPYEPPPFDPERDSDVEPPFLEEWLEAEEFRDVVGQACVSIVHSCLEDYLDGVIERSDRKGEAKKFLKQRQKKVGRESRFSGYAAFFGDAYSIDWSQSPVPTEALEEITQARNDIWHGRPAFGLGRYRNERHRCRFPLGLFVDEITRKLVLDHPERFDSQVHVSPDAFKEVVRRVLQFCRFVESCTSNYIAY